MTSPAEPEVHSADKAWLYGVTAVLALLSAGVGWAAVVEQLPWLWAIVAVGAAGVVLFAVFIVRGVPLLVFSADGLAHDSGARQRFWAWQDVGPFSLDTIRGRGWRRTYVLCALTDARYDLLTKHGEPADVGIGNADVLIALSLLKANRNEAAAQACAERINSWRALYGAPEVEAPDAPAAATRLRRQLRRGSRRRWALVVVVAIGVVAGMGFVRWWQPGWFGG